MTPLLNPFQILVLQHKKGVYYTGQIREICPSKGSNNNEIINTLRGKSLTVRVTFNNQERIENLGEGLPDKLPTVFLYLKFCWIRVLAAKGFSENALGMCCLTVTIFLKCHCRKFRNNVEMVPKFLDEASKQSG